MREQDGKNAPVKNKKGLERHSLMLTKTYKYITKIIRTLGAESRIIRKIGRYQTKGENRT